MMIGLDYAVAIGTASVSAAALSVITAALALWKRSSRAKDTVRVTIDGRAFEIEHVDRDDIESVLAGVKRKVSEERHTRALADAVD